MATFRDLYPDYAGESQVEKSVPETADQNVLEQTTDAPEKSSVSKKQGVGIVGAFVLLIAVMLLLQFA